MRSLLVVLALLFNAESAVAQSPTPSNDTFVRAHRAVSTAIPAAQAAFDDGFTLLYAYNPEQARRSFERARTLDPSLAIAWWGVAMSYGVNINSSYDAGDAKKAHIAIAKAMPLQAAATPVERALIDAASKRFAFTGANDGDRSAHAYHDAMLAVAKTFPDDDDVQALTAEAGMDEHPWAFYKDDGTPEPGTQDIVSRLQLVLARNPAHIGAEHFIIHAVEASQHPELALEAAKQLAADTFQPGAEHLTHMPAHTFERVGMYHEAGLANARAVDAFSAYLSAEPDSAHKSYLGHDCRFGVDAFMMAGEYERATHLAQTCAARGIGASMVRVVQMRFGHWDKLTRDGPDTFVTSMLALHDHDLATATKDAKDLAAQDSTSAKIEAAVTDAAVARERDDASAEIANLTHAVSLQDNDGYAEPPAFWFPVREKLGAAELRASSAREAAATFRIDLTKNPNNPRSLFGLAIALDRLGDAAGATDARNRYQLAWAHADAPLTIEDL